MRRVPLVLALLVAACATREDPRFPSLAMRPAERVTGTMAPGTPEPPPPALTPTTGDRLAALRGQALAAHRLFGEHRGRTAALAAAGRGAAPGSESWSVAQVALADLESSRSEAMIALADLDRLYVEASLAAAQSGGSPELDAVAKAREEVAGWIAEEDAVLAGLRGQVGD